MPTAKIAHENLPKGLLPTRIKVAELPSVVSGYRYVSGSRTAAVFGLSKWQSKRQLAEYILGAESEPRNDDSGIMAMGTALEPIIWKMGLAAFVAESVVYDDTALAPAKLTAPQLALSGTPDAIALRDDKLILVEIKNTSYAKWVEVPPVYYWQVQTYLLLTGIAHGEIWALHRGNDLQRYEIPANAERQAELITAIGNLHAQLSIGELPEPTTMDDYKSAIAAYGERTTDGKSVDINNPDLARRAAFLIREKAEHNKRGRDLDLQEKELHNDIAAAMGDAQTANLGGIIAKHTTTERKAFTVAARTIRGMRLSQPRGENND